MPFTVLDLIEAHSVPVTVSGDDSAQTALKLMIDGDYSQLPVVDHEGKAKGMITSDSIIRALSHFDLTIKSMRVFHAMVDVKKYRTDDDLFALLDDLKDVYAVAVVDKEGYVIGIVTSYDTTEYFRRRGEDIMLVEDIETMLREYVVAAFVDQSGELDRSSLDAAIEDITPSNSKLRGPFQQALHRYLQLRGDDSPDLNPQHVEDAFAQHLNAKSSPRPFDRLTLNDYIELFLSKGRWDRYKPIFDLDPSSCRNLLEAVRNTRNELAHFRAELTAQKREELRFCKDWLARHQPEIAYAFQPLAVVISQSLADRAESEDPRDGEGKTEVVNTANELFNAIRLGNDPTDELPVQLVEPPDSRDSRYTPLALYLQSQPIGQEKVDISFTDIELLIGVQLPMYARRHRSWWANDTTGHVQSQRWLEAGWRVSSVNMSGERVTFSRMKEREQDYIDFYSSLLSVLRDRNEIPVRASSTLGQSWLSIASLAPEAATKASFFGCAFARRRRFRVELYIDEGDQEMNKAIFDELHKNRDKIEAEVEAKLSWERLDHRRASRVALYHSGAITDGPEGLAELRDLAVDSVVRLYGVFKARFAQILRTTKVSTSPASTKTS